jgi:hypothetical protein
LDKSQECKSRSLVAVSGNQLLQLGFLVCYYALAGVPSFEILTQIDVLALGCAVAACL